VGGPGASAVAHLRVSYDRPNLFQRLGKSRDLFRSGPPAVADVLKRAEGGPSKLWAAGISATCDRAVRIDASEKIWNSPASWVRAHEYWQLKRLAVDWCS